MQSELPSNSAQVVACLDIEVPYNTICISCIVRHLTHWGRVTYICVHKLTIIVSDNGLSPCRHQSIIRTNARIVLIGPPGNFNWNSYIFIPETAFDNVWKTAAIFSRPQCVNSPAELTIMHSQYVLQFDTWSTDNCFVTDILSFYPRPVLAFGYCRCLRVCVCVCLSVNHQLVRAVTHQPFKLESPNLDQRCKRPWLRSLLFF